MKIQTTNNQDVQYHILKTEHKDFVTGFCSIPMGYLYTDYSSRLIPNIVSAMLRLGTESKTEEEMNELLESKGIHMHAEESGHNIRMSFTCLTKYLDETIALIAEQFQSPKFNETSFEHLKQRYLAQYAGLNDNTGYRAQVAFSQEMFPKGHLGYLNEPSELIEIIKAMSVEDLKKYHKEHINFKEAVWVIVGDVPSDVQSICEKHMPTDGQSSEIQRKQMDIEIKPSEKKVTIDEKQSVDFMMGHALDMDRQHPDYLPLMLGLDALGGSFSARLMRTVRDEDGLTYNVGSSLSSGVNGSQCYWSAHGSFAPQLLDKGIKAIEHQLKLWIDEGLTEEEFLERKTGLLGKYQVRLSDANVLCSKIVGSLEQGFEASYLYTYCDEIEKITLEGVNRVIKQYIQLDKVIKVSAGSI